MFGILYVGIAVEVFGRYLEKLDASSFFVKNCIIHYFFFFIIFEIITIFLKFNKNENSKSITLL